MYRRSDERRERGIDFNRYGRKLPQARPTVSAPSAHTYFASFFRARNLILTFLNLEVFAVAFQFPRLALHKRRVPH